MNGIESIINQIDTMGVSAESLIYHISLKSVNLLEGMFLM